MSVDDMIERGELERVVANERGARKAVDDARRHIKSASSVVRQDRNGAYQLAYDAARKAVVASMRRAGVRVRVGEGAHVLTAAYAAVALDESLGLRLEAMRRRRNASEYGAMFFSESEVLDAIGVATALVELVDS